MIFIHFDYVSWGTYGYFGGVHRRSSDFYEV